MVEAIAVVILLGIAFYFHFLLSPKFRRFEPTPGPFQPTLTPKQELEQKIAVAAERWKRSYELRRRIEEDLTAFFTADGEITIDEISKEDLDMLQPVVRRILYGSNEELVNLRTLEDKLKVMNNTYTRSLDAVNIGEILNSKREQ
jgi:hypothetical protein